MSLYEQVKRINEATYTIDRLIFKHYKQYLNIGITTQQVVVLDIVYVAKRSTVGEIAMEMNISSSAVSQLIAKLEKNQYIKREINLQNRREIFITLDEKGVEYFSKQDYVKQQISDKIYSKLTSKDVNQLERIVEKLKEIAMKEL
ncbi:MULTISPECIES: MarR family winged helix-turn-helix transcriptional regulator [Bacillus]|uniref:MarR family winged helix-turn-helix transcriptional regulator n=1 Tax=Bacillus TaxID=1386 RepID=UPI00030943CB|nr:MULTISPECIES: MarR family transcriptional regulator [Bacillus]MBR9655491.1 MarR family transcriptional regulator [Bacillus cereus]MCU4760631.1 MarR family transcriptional regulator [Bacillus cereus]MCU4900000.1 MarR family transcriptional regulator [Bacillus cereus]MCU5313043.1 MarR family transcriptional regulator [Bacillus cereus]MCU5438566.1 MarR family transcriptional regulator [Bacillus cereus]